MRSRLLLLSLLLAACGGSSNTGPNNTNNNPPSGGDTTIPAAVATQLSGALTAQVPALAARSTNHALAARGAALALQAGGKSTEVTLTASLLEPRPPQGEFRSAALSSGTAQAFGFQLVVSHAPETTGPLTLSGVLAFEGGAQLVLVAGPSPGSPIPPAVGVLYSSGALWVASAGQEGAQLQQENQACPVSLPAFVTSCKLAQFISAGFDVTASTPATGSASGSRTASLPARSLTGVSLAIDCALTTLCGGSSNTSIQVAVVPAGAALVASESIPFSATVSNTSDEDVTWSVDEPGGGEIDGSGMYSAPATPGEYTVRAKSHADPSKSGQAKVRVTSPGIVFADARFLDASWTMVVIGGGNGGTGSAVQVQTDGDPGEARQISHHVNAAASGAISEVFTFHLFQDMTYDPASQGAIQSIDFAEDLRFPTTRGQGSGLALRQNEKVYYAIPSYTLPAESIAWMHRVVLGIVASDFVLLKSDGNQVAEHPDFSAAGMPIEVGFVRANSTNVGGAAYDRIGYIDNWWVNIHPN
jgi:hypothetical protein